MSTKKLCQFIAIESSVKARVTADLTEAHKDLQKGDLFNGHSRRYEPRNEDPNSPLGEKLPEEHKKVVARAEAIVKLTLERLTEQYDLAATRDYGNCLAKADVEVEGKVLLKDVPVAHLLFLEKRLDDLLTFVRKLPTLDPTETWEFNPSQDLYATAPVQTARSKKIARALVLYEATKEHPAGQRDHRGCPGRHLVDDQVLVCVTLAASQRDVAPCRRAPKSHQVRPGESQLH
jgi:hypothetical protein